MRFFAIANNFRVLVLVLMIPAVHSCSSGGSGSDSSGELSTQSIKITQVSVDSDEGTFLAEALPVGNGPRPTDLGGYILPDQNLIILNVQPESAVDQFLVGVVGDHFVVDLRTSALVGSSSQAYSILLRTENSHSSSLNVAVAGHGERASPIQFEYH